MHDLKAENILLKSLLDSIRRKYRFERNWLKRKHPEVFDLMQKASDQNDKDFLDRVMRNFNKHIDREFNK